MPKPKLPAIDPADVESQRGSRYPGRLKEVVGARIKQRLGDAVGLTRFGVNLVRMPPKSWSALRHWHTHQDEFIYVLEGELTLVTDSGRQTLKPGHAAGFPAGRNDGHHLINESGRDAVYLEVGDRPASEKVYYPEEDLVAEVDGPGGARFVHRDGRPY
jgi:uncharacterized cupin superfamily protein